MLYSLRSRLMFAFSLLLIIPFTAVVIILSEQSAKLIRSSIESSTLQTIDQFASHVTTLLTQIEDTGNQMLSSRFTQDLLAVHLNSESPYGERFAAKLELREFFSSYAINNSNVISISAFTRDGGGFWTQDRSFADSEWYKQYETKNRRWTQAHQDPDQPDEYMKKRYVNSFVLPLVQLQSLYDVGIIKVNYPTELLQQDLDKIRFGKTGRAFLLTDDGMSVLNQDLAGMQDVLGGGLAYVKAHGGKQTAGIFPLKQHNENYLLIYRELPVQNWIIVGVVPEAELYAAITQTRQTMLYVSFALLIAVIVVAVWISIGITRPLSAMARAMKYVKYGQFDQALKFMPKGRAKQGEVDYVIGVFEQMTHRLKHLIETEFETDLRRKNAEYKALLLQINPHFYNNTLEIISGLAAMKRNDLVMDVAEALGKMMRYSLNLHSDRVKVGEEFSYIRDYTFILKLRHEDKLVATIDEDPAADSLYMPKFILQPIVENAVKYSLEKGETARVFVASSLKDDRLWLTVKDNGVGMSEELIRDILADTEIKDAVAILNAKGRSIGLRNVLSRCRLYYDDRFEVILDSEVGAGTTIILKLPPVRS